MVFDEIKALVTLGAGVSLDAQALTHPQLVELAARTVQTGAKLTLRRAERLTAAQREQLAQIAGPAVHFAFGG